MKRVLILFTLIVSTRIIGAESRIKSYVEPTVKKAVPALAFRLSFKDAIFTTRGFFKALPGNGNRGFEYVGSSRATARISNRGVVETYEFNVEATIGADYFLQSETGDEPLPMSEEILARLKQDLKKVQDEYLAVLKKAEENPRGSVELTIKGNDFSLKFLE
jgi:hypothetical protein